MQINGKHYRTIWLKEGAEPTVQVIDQRRLPHAFVIEDLHTLEDFVRAIREMHVRGAPLIGVTAAYAVYNALYHAPSDKRRLGKYIRDTVDELLNTRPTAVNLSYALERMMKAIESAEQAEEMVRLALQTADAIAEESVEHCRAIGQHGLEIIRKISKKKKGEPVNILTHCNAGWLACIDHGTATAPIYAAHDEGIPIHVWVDETRPRNQGANLTAYELLHHGVPNTVITDNAGGHLMQHGMVDLVIVGSDRTTLRGDVANKIGTYLKALAARDNRVPFYVALPSSSFDWSLNDGLKEIPIEERDPDEVRYVHGWFNGKIYKVLITPQDSRAANFAFDVTPARLVDGLITERGICKASRRGIQKLFPEAGK
ncbi:MAG: S-methyl-5-thioribose-1-phosphate isomerase [Phaeodactylibacter sp.]|nr:S-methyl-5-thioribose-1-phosphate isomerase [Phaeodactylibacter sp.]MCB0598777.1 S-methyl-5-thioribose-1-phosphate isomerase [Phaeodactylibacter sp.]MCB9053801.1 S-methyl-5-thioribose-1-phosphate isomerase [Lewinellaceae bacterium]